VPQEGQPSSQSDGMQLEKTPASQQTPSAQLANMDLETPQSGPCSPSPPCIVPEDLHSYAHCKAYSFIFCWKTQCYL
jgi:hypothetical protein